MAPIQLPSSTTSLPSSSSHPRQWISLLSPTQNLTSKSETPLESLFNEGFDPHTFPLPTPDNSIHPSDVAAVASAFDTDTFAQAALKSTNHSRTNLSNRPSSSWPNLQLSSIPIHQSQSQSSKPNNNFNSNHHQLSSSQSNLASISVTLPLTNHPTTITPTTTPTPTNIPRNAKEARNNRRKVLRARRGASTTANTNSTPRTSRSRSRSNNTNTVTPMNVAVNTVDNNSTRPLTSQEKKAARVIRNREVALRARMAAKTKMYNLESENTTLRKTASSLEVENTSLKEQIECLKRNVAVASAVGMNVSTNGEDEEEVRKDKQDLMAVDSEGDINVTNMTEDDDDDDSHMEIGATNEVTNTTQVNGNNNGNGISLWPSTDLNVNLDNDVGMSQ